ncbi:MAG: DUF3800 domain-containing protein [Leptospiraceae bacterium]|nr:DUF3800 domain-containing protein [Leptospiraceae bacterium]
MKLKCYFDESGNSGLDFTKKEVSSHFILAGILVNEMNLEKLEALSRQISITHFQGSEIKSSKVGDNDNRRLKILEEILTGDYFIYAIVFDKRKIFSKGLRYKKSFYKYFNRVAYKSLCLSFPNLEIIADQTGSKEFMDGFQKYILKNYTNRDLFGNADFSFSDSKGNPVTQVADFIVGSLARCYDSSIISERKDEILHKLVGSKKLLPIQEWPEREEEILKSTTLSIRSEFEADNQIYDLSKKYAKHFIESNAKNNDEYVPEQVETVKILLFNSLYGRREEYIPTKEIINLINVKSNLSVEAKPFGRCVIGPLRDAGVLIASNTTGYKLVTTLTDLIQFVQYFDHFIKPMLERIKNYRDIVQIGTLNKVDILEHEKFEYLRKFFAE